MYRLIVTWGAHEQKKKAAMSFVLYTVFGSLILLVVILVSLLTFKTTSIDVMSAQFPGEFVMICFIMSACVYCFCC